VDKYVESIYSSHQHVNKNVNKKEARLGVDYVLLFDVVMVRMNEAIHKKSFLLFYLS
jgi:hypothetical protein